MMGHGPLPDPAQWDPRLTLLPGSPSNYDPAAKTLYGKRAEFEDFDVASFFDRRTLVAFVRGMRTVEACEDEVDGFQQVGWQILVCGKGVSHTAALKVCWCCKWLSEAHRTDCPWKAVRDVNAL